MAATLVIARRGVAASPTLHGSYRHCVAAKQQAHTARIGRLVLFAVSAPLGYSGLRKTPIAKLSRAAFSLCWWALVGAHRQCGFICRCSTRHGVAPRRALAWPELVGCMSNAEIIVPCYNEQHRLQPAAIAALVAAGIRVIFVDDGSTDGTLHGLQQLAQRHGPAVHVMALPHNVGKAEAIRQGFTTTSTALWRGYCDADAAVPASEIIRLLHIAQQQSDVGAVLGARVGLAGRTITRRASRHYAGRVFATLAALTLDARIYDTQCGLKWFRNQPALQAALAEPFRSPWLFDVELLGRLLLLFQANSHIRANQIYEEPLLAWEDIAGSKLRPHDFVASPWHLLCIRFALHSWRQRVIAPTTLRPPC